MTKYLAGVLSVIAAGVLLIAYGLLAPQASATFSGSDRFGVMQTVPQSGGAAGYAISPNGAAYPYQAVVPAAGAPYAVPVNVIQPPMARPAVYEVAPARQETTAAAQAPRRVTRTVERAPRRDWKKTALIIGGSSATGAGVGAVFGGKKGALIGAAIGGGASTIWQTTRR